MKNKSALVIGSLFPLMVVAILAMIGITFNVWVYLILAVVCPLVAVAVLFIYRGMEKKVTEAGRESLKSRQK